LKWKSLSKYEAATNQKREEAFIERNIAWFYLACLTALVLSLVSGAGEAAKSLIG
jgi:hypothetical protein